MKAVGKEPERLWTKGFVKEMTYNTGEHFVELKYQLITIIPAGEEAF